MVSSVKPAKGEPRGLNAQSVTGGRVRSKGWCFSIKSRRRSRLSSPTQSELVWRDSNSYSLDFKLWWCNAVITDRLPTKVWICRSDKAECCLAIACFTSFTLISLNLSLQFNKVKVE